jgi:hypothetical protein
MPETPWHAVVARHGQAPQAVKALEALECVAETCAPSRVTIEVRGGKRMEHRAFYLGPLVLGRWDGADPHVWHDINDLPSVFGIFGGWPPADVPDGQVERMLDRIRDAELNAPVVLPPCKAGDIVRFSHLGMFFRVVARCIWVCERDQTVGVRVRLLGHDHIVTVPYEGIESRQEVNGRQFGRGGRRRVFIAM